MKREEVKGENLTCKEPWFASIELSGFLLSPKPVTGATAASEIVPYVTCAYFRYFVADGVPDIKLGQEIQFVAGFNVYQSA